MTPGFDISAALATDLKGWMRSAAIVGIALLLLSAIGAFFSPADFFRGYLTGYLFATNIALGCLGLLMLQYLTGGAWGLVSRRTMEAATRTFPLLAVLFIPLVVGIPWLYDWAHSDLVARDEILRHRHPWMNPTFFIVRAIAYWIIWIGLAWLLNKWSREQDEEEPVRNKLRRLSAPGLIVYVFSVTFASIDWAESLTTHWYSTMWGFLFVAMQGLSAMAVLILVLALLSKYEPLSGILKPVHFHDLGKLLLTLVMLWGYFSFSQLLIVWSGNLVGEITWYIRRMNTSWGWLGGSLIVLQFVVPFLLLLSRPLKRNRALLCTVSGLILFMRFVETTWIVMPSYYRDGLRLVWLDLTTPLGLIFLWCAAFLWQLGKRPLLPLHAPTLELALHHEES